MARTKANVRIVIRYNRFPEVARRAPEKAKAVVAEHAYLLEQKAKDKAPFKTGALKNSISTEFEEGGLRAIVAPHVEYAIYQELGTYKMAAHPYLGPAAEEVGPKFRSAMEDILDEW